MEVADVEGVGVEEVDVEMAGAVVTDGVDVCLETNSATTALILALRIHASLEGRQFMVPASSMAIWKCLP